MSAGNSQSGMNAANGGVTDGIDIAPLLARGHLFYDAASIEATAQGECAIRTLWAVASTLCVPVANQSKLTARTVSQFTAPALAMRFALKLAPTTS